MGEGEGEGEGEGALVCFFLTLRSLLLGRFVSSSLEGITPSIETAAVLFIQSEM